MSPASLLQRLGSVAKTPAISLQNKDPQGSWDPGQVQGHILRKPGLGALQRDPSPPTLPLPPTPLLSPVGDKAAPLEEKPSVHPQGYGPHLQLRLLLGQRDALSHLVSRQTKDVKPGFQNEEAFSWWGPGSKT